MIVIWFLLFLLPLPGIAASIYNISEIGKAGIYFEHVGKVNHFDSEWNLMTYLDISDIHKKINLIDITFVETNQVCEHDKFNDLSLCQTSLIILEQIIPQLHNQANVLKELTDENQRRVKRSYIDGVGNMLKVLFGTLDSNDAKKYDEEIGKLNKTEHDVLTLLKTQSNIVRTTISNFNNCVTDLTNNEKIFNKNLETLTNHTKGVEIKLFNINLKQDLDEHLSLLTLITTEVNNEITTVTNTILFAICY